GGGADDPTGRDTADRLLIRPGVQLGGSFADVAFDDPPAQNVVRCSADDPAAGGLDYLAVDPATALDHGCSASADQQGAAGGSTPTADRICQAQYPNGAAHTVGRVMTYDREGSLNQVCAGFGKPDGLTLTGPMACALIAAAAYGGGSSGAGHATGTLCDRASVASDFASGDWVGAAGGIACSFFSDVFATGAGLAMAGATAETGPGAEAVGLATYKALSAGLGVACAGALGGGPTGLGRRLESNHETHVAIDIVDHGKCLAINQTPGVSFAAVTCPD